MLAVPSTAPRQPLAQPPITFQAPFAAHRFASRAAQHTARPKPARALSARGASIVLGKTPLQVGCPADVGSIAVFAPTTKNANKAFHVINFAAAVAVVVGATKSEILKSAY